MSGGESHTYTYGDSNWRDLLTKYDGTTISYDTNGNPTSYYNGSSYTMAWKNGRQLSSVTKGGTTTTYTYDATGVRDSKTVGGVKYTFYTSNGQVGRQYANGKYWTFLYDNQGRPNVLIYDGTVYYYVLNLQGDVIGLVNTSGTYVAQYAYDAWGKCISSSGTLADVNPLRYRGYYYDSETGFYYLGSRYYDPAIKRFINADAYASTGQGLAGYNMFTYCGNNPICMTDASGTLAVEACVVSNAVYAIAMQLLWDTIATISIFEIGKGLFEGLAEENEKSFGASVSNSSSGGLTTSYTKVKAAVAQATSTVRKEKQYNYWLAVYVPCGNRLGTYVPTIGLTFDEAKKYVRRGQDIFARDQTYAYSLAVVAGRGRPVGSERHFDRFGKQIGYWPHFHLKGRKGGHIFYASNIS